MQIFVRGIAGQTFTLTGVTKLGDVKRLVHTRSGVPPREQVLSFGGKPLSGEHLSLDRLGIRELSTIQLSLRLAGGQKDHNVNSDDYYAVLGVPRQATEGDIAKAYRKLALKYHPDRNPGNPKAEENFKRVTEAYEVLKDKSKREHFDRFGKEVVGGGDSASTGAPGTRGTGATFTYAEADETFRRFFGGQDPFAAFAGASRTGGASNQPQGARIFSGLGSFPDGIFGFGEFGGNRGRFTGPTRRGRATAAGPASRREMGEGIPEGTAVLIHGLTKSTQHNGSVGTVVAHDEAESGRVVVRLNGSADVLALQPHNLQLLLPCTLSGLTSAARLNGTRAFIRGEAGNGRYLVTVPEEGVDQIAVKLRNIVLDNDTPIAIEGLQPSSRHNGRTGVVVDAVPDGSRYTIQTGDGQMLKVKPEHLRVRLSSL